MNKKIIGLIVLILSSFLLIINLSIAIYEYGYKYHKNYGYSLYLADDASLPEDKANYLREYRSKIKEIKGEPRWFFVREDLNKEKQIKILDGLIKRFDDIAKIQPSEMAYQQGMLQLSGQEIDNQIDKISSIFLSAKIRETPIKAIFMWWGWTIIVLGIIFGMHLFFDSEEY